MSLHTTNRRSFISRIGLIVASASSPLIYLPKIEPFKWKVPQVPKIRILTCKWSVELEQDLQAYHGINAEKEITALMVNCLKQDFDVNVTVTDYQIESNINDKFMSPKKVCTLSLDKEINYIPELFCRYNNSLNVH